MLAPFPLQKMRPHFTVVADFNIWNTLCTLILPFETCLLKKKHCRLVIKLWFIGGYEWPFFLIQWHLTKSKGVAKRPTGQKILTAKHCYLFKRFHSSSLKHRSTCQSFSCFSEMISWGICRKTNNRFFSILGEGWRQIQLQNTWYFKCKMVLP